MIKDNDFITKHYASYKLGSQGPDPFLYISSKDKHAKIGDFMHEDDTGTFFINFLKYLKTRPNDEVKSFLYGMINHYSLDSSIHPYIYYTTGVYDYSKPETHQYRGQHLLLERTIDKIFLNEMVDEGTKPTNSYQMAFKNVSASDIVIEYLEEIISKTYKIKGYGLKYRKCVNKMKNITRYVAIDRTGLKKSILKVVDSLFNSKNKVYLPAVSYHLTLDQQIDYLNLSHFTWLHPVNGESSTQSFIDLFELGITKAVKLINIAEMYLNNEVKVEELKLHFKNVSYDTGLENVGYKELKIFGTLPMKKPSHK